MTTSRRLSRWGGLRAVLWWPWPLAVIAVLLTIWIWDGVASNRARMDLIVTITYAKQLEVAIGQHQHVYGSLPWTSELGAGGDLIVEGDRYEALIQGLAAKDPVLNPRHQKYLELDENDHYYDAWGRDFLVILDVDNDDTITHADFGTRKRNIAIWSAGPDGEWEPPVTDASLPKNRDNVTSWEKRNKRQRNR